MKIRDILGENFAGSFASVSFPMTPGTKAKDARKAVDPMGYITPKKKKQKEYKMGYSSDVGNLVYNKPVKSPMIKRDAK